jgi:hypothetical protein
MSIIAPPPEAWLVDGIDRSLIIVSRELALGALRDGVATPANIHDWLRLNFVGNLDGDSDMRKGIADALAIFGREIGGKPRKRAR